MTKCSLLGAHRVAIVARVLVTLRSFLSKQMTKATIHEMVANRPSCTYFLRGENDYANVQSVSLCVLEKVRLRESKFKIVW